MTQQDSVSIREKELVSIGAKELDKKQREKILPGYDNIKKQISEMRDYAKILRANKEKKPKDKEGIYESVNVNNVFSILGKRGAGKSSILYTIRKDIKSVNSISMIPTDLEERDLMGWILASFNEEVGKRSERQAIEDNKEQVKTSGFGSCRKEARNTAIYEKYNKVLEQYNFTKQDYSEILRNTFSGLKEYVAKSKKVLDPKSELKRSFFEFIDELVNLKSRINEDNEEPMIFIFLDDIDLAKDKCREILKVIIRYLCHPNIIVFVSGDYEMFETEQLMSNLKSSNLLGLIAAPRENNIRGEKLILDNENLARDTLKKIMPPVYRYKLKALSPLERLEFYYGDNNKKTLKKLFGDKFKKIKNNKDSKDLEIINAYGLMFDEMPRGIMNVYYSLNSLEDGITEKLKNNDEEAINEFRFFAKTIVRASSILSKYEDIIDKCIQINKPFSETFFNHERLMKEIDGVNRLTEENKSNMDKQQLDTIIHEKIVVLIFSHFIESIVKVVDPGRKIHGQGELNKLLNEKEIQKDKFKIYPKLNTSSIVLNLYEAMLSNDAVNIMPTMDNIYLKDFSVKFYFEELAKILGLFNEEETKKPNLNRLITELVDNDSEWLEEKVKIIYYHRKPLFMMCNKAIDVAKNKVTSPSELGDLDVSFNEEKYKNLFGDADKLELLEKEVDKFQLLEKDEEELNKKYKDIDNRRDEVTKDEIISMAKEVYKINKYLENNLIRDISENNDNKIELSNFIEKDSTTEKEFIKKQKGLSKKLDDYFSQIRISTETVDGKIANIFIKNKALKELKESEEYELAYFAYFEKWYKKLYKDEEEVEKQENSSPLTRILKKVRGDKATAACGVDESKQEKDNSNSTEESTQGKNDTNSILEENKKQGE